MIRLNFFEVESFVIYKEKKKEVIHLHFDNLDHGKSSQKDN